MFITFEGIDGSGKSTQIKLLKEYFLEMGYDVICIREPGGTELSEQIRSLLLYGKNKISPVTELLLFEAARSSLVEEVIKPAIEKGRIVISDRFFDSTTAYQGYGRGLNIQNIEFTNTLATNQLSPDITFFLDVSVKTSNYRSMHRNMDRIEASGNDFFSKVRLGFHDIAKKHPERIFIINAEDIIYNTHNKILDILIDKYPQLKKQKA
jgi:dTMP kinase